MLKSQHLHITHLLTCGLAFFTVSLSVHSVNPEDQDNTKREAEEDLNPLNLKKSKIEENRPLLEFEAFEDYILIKDRQNKSIQYYFNDTDTFKFYKLTYQASDSENQWHALGVHSWSLVPHLPLLNEKLKNNPQEKYNFVVYKKNVTSRKGEVKEKTIPCIEFERELIILKPDKRLSYLLINLEDNLKVKVDQLDFNNRGQLMIDTSMLIPYFDYELPIEWKLEMANFTDSTNQLLFYKENHFYIRQA